ncbi:MAG: cupredoxin domain-containing protein [Actinomycetota bacterium]|nr:cupredoxin domain-containing protein [Actinomycetota bacterium]MDQ2958487.1 cupredoxin domain-containing protein [Actinomycetota bacterium]
MPTPRRSGQLLLAGAALSGLALTGCSSSSTTKTGSAGTTQIKVSLSNDGCTPDPASVPAGPATFTIKNEEGSAVSEAELVSGTKILGEKEGLTPGLSGTFSLNLQPGSFQVYCPNAKTERSGFTVTGAAAGASSTPTAGTVALLSNATSGYKTYVEAQAAKLLTLTAGFTTAVKAGDVARAKALYAQARAPYEAIEPVAESFGDLDPDIDARQGDVPDAQWGGYHRIEQQLWIHHNTTGMFPVATKLLADVNTLIAKIKTTTYQPADLANGATDLLTEVGKTKLEGEEERYSRTDLTDIQANLEGSQAAFDLLAPALKVSDDSLVTTIQARFTDMRTLMQKYATGGGSFTLYTQLTQPQIRELTVAVDALAEPLSQVGEKIVAIK